MLEDTVRIRLFLISQVIWISKYLSIAYQSHFKDWQLFKNTPSSARHQDCRHGSVGCAPWATAAAGKSQQLDPSASAKLYYNNVIFSLQNSAGYILQHRLCLSLLGRQFC